ncbi:DnaD domain protein [Lapidilactobacillus bayanensis]|uniref:DnaD domain protein n=1 Tax=Lapidilactobacillus bayanensis TaxID=2485998 RepID=UPI0013DE287F|nr:DnaD domain protein [Lapidilactobacillus bayanensis]
MKTETNVDPQLGYFLVRGANWSDLNQRVFTALYQPILSAQAFALYLTLWHEVDDHQLISQRSVHFELFDLMDQDAQTFLKSRQQLEACGLLKTYQKRDTLGEYLIYRLLAPLAPEKFFQEEILATYLLDRVSRKKFMALQREFQLPDVDLSNTQELTVGFLDVFHMADSALLTPPKEVKAGAAKFKQAQTTAAVSEISPAELAAFDWQTLIALVGRNQIPEAEITQHKSDIFGLQRFYGFSLTDIARLISRSINVATNRINFSMLEERALALYQQLNPDQTAVAQPDQTPTQNTTSKNFTAAQQNLLTQAKQLAPADFLRDLKQQQHSYVAQNEYRNVKKLQQRGVLNDATINILIYVVVRDYTTVTMAPIDTVAQNWLKQGINTPEAAITYLSQRDQKPLQQKSRATSRQKPAGVTPDWLKKQQAANQPTTAVVKDAKVDPKQQRNIAKKLAELNKASQKRGE